MRVERLGTPWAEVPALVVDGVRHGLQPAPAELEVSGVDPAAFDAGGPDRVGTARDAGTLTALAGAADLQARAVHHCDGVRP